MAHINYRNVITFENLDSSEEFVSSFKPLNSKTKTFHYL